jgi:hypothetical protein
VDPETIFAVAYTDTNTADGGYNPAVDVLIAKWVDDNGSGVADAGDKIITNQYPEDFGFSSFGTFGVTEHTVASVGASNGATECVANLPPSATGEDQLVSFSADAIDERYGEWGDVTNIASFTTFVDGFPGSIGGDVIGVVPASPSQAPGPLNAQRSAGGDDAFLDVELNC